MLRRVARIFRFVLFTIGAFLVAWTPVSFAVVVSVWIPIPAGQLVVFEAELGNGVVATLPALPAEYREVDLLFRRPSDDPVYMVPLADFDYQYDRRGAGYLSLPLWLPAFLCLAWPVTSFVIARRRRRTRGFEVGMNPEPQRGGSSQSPGQRPG